MMPTLSHFYYFQNNQKLLKVNLNCFISIILMQNNTSLIFTLKRKTVPEEEEEKKITKII